MKTLLIFLLSTCSVFAQLNISNPFYVAGVLKPASSGAATSATDTFNRADSNPLSTTMSDGVSVWTSGPGAANDIQIASNEAGGTAANSGARVLSPTFSANHISTITIGSGGGVPSGMGPVVRYQSTTDASGYVLFVDSTTTLILYRLDDTGSFAFTQVGASFTVATLVAGDAIGLSVSGSTFTAFVNGAQTGTTRTDATYSTGQPGIYAQNAEYINSFTASDL